MSTTTTRPTGLNIAEDVLRQHGWTVNRVALGPAVHLAAHWKRDHRLIAVITTSKASGWLATPRLDGRVAGNLIDHALHIGADPWVLGVDVRPEVSEVQDRMVRWERLQPVVERLGRERTAYVAEAPEQRSHDGLVLGLRVVDLALPIR